MKSFSQLNPARSTFAGIFGLILCLLALPCSAQQDIESGVEKDAKPPFDVFNQAIDNLLIYKHIEEKAVLQKDSQAPDAVDTLKRQLTSAKPTSDIELDSLVSQPVPEADDLYQHMVKSSLFLGKFYDCGRCDRSHLALSGGIVISESRLALTNYHVMDPKVMGTTEGFIAMAYDGQCFEVEKVLAADQVADIALVQLKANGYKFHAAPIAKSRPSPMNTVHIVSNPSGEFFSLSSGMVSRYSKVRPRKGDRGRSNAAWLEITAEFGGGSSGSGIFNAAGEVVGLVSRIRPLKRASSKQLVAGKELTKQGYVQMIVRRCVDLNSIKACFASEKTNADLPTVEVEAEVLQGD